MKTVRLLILLFIPIMAFQCNDDEVNPCSQGGPLDECLTNASGVLYFKNDINAYVIRYFVPGTIDSHKTGVICESETGVIELEKSINIKVIFDGCFYDDKGDIQPTSILGGEEFFYLKITSIIPGE